MSTKVSVPGPSPAEEALRTEQVQVLRQQRDLLQDQLRQQNLLAPILFKQAGLIPQLSEEGNIIGLSEDPMQAEVRKGFLERSRAALAGELPVNPALMRDLATQEQQLREGLRKQLGTGFETSTPGMEALQRFGESRNILLEGARRGDLTLAEQLGLQRAGAAQQSGQFAAGAILPSIGGLGNVAQGFMNPLGILAGDRQMQMQANMANAQAKAQTMGSLFGGIGMLGGMALGGPLGGAIGAKLFGAPAG